MLNTSYPTYRIRLTVDVDTPSGPRTGFNVYEVRTSRTGSNFPASPGQVSYSVRGESVAVDLPDGTLFTIVEPDWIGSLLVSAHNYYRRTKDLPDEPNDPSTIRKIVARGDSIVLPLLLSPDPLQSGYPQMVRFRDTSDPASVEWIVPEKIEEKFGPGVNIKRVMVQITDEPLTRGIEKRLAWLSHYYNNGLNLNGVKSVAVSTNEAADNLAAGSFSSELGS